MSENARITVQALSQMQRCLNHRHRACHQRAAGRLGLYYGQPPVLLILLECPNLSQKELAERMNTTGASVAVSVKRLEKAGLLQRRSSEQDARRNALCLTEKGRALAERCRGEMDRINCEMYVGFTPAEQQQLAGFYRRMSENLQNLQY